MADITPKGALRLKLGRYLIFVIGRDVACISEFSRSYGILFGQLQEKRPRKETYT
jgi:hypothetical protein